MKQSSAILIFKSGSRVIIASPKIYQIHFLKQIYQNKAACPGEV